MSHPLELDPTSMTGPDAPERTPASRLEDAAQWFLTNFEAVSLTHNTSIPNGGKGALPIFDRNTLFADPDHQPKDHVSSLNLSGRQFRLAADSDARTVGNASLLANDLGGSTPASLLDLVVANANDIRERTGLSEETIAALRDRLQAADTRAPRQLTTDHAIIYFEAGGEEVLITPAMPTRLMRDINSRLAHRLHARARARMHPKLPKFVDLPHPKLAMPISQGGAQPQNAGHSFIQNPRVAEDGSLSNSGSRRGGYLALRALAPTGHRQEAARAAARVSATGQLSSIGSHDYQSGRAFIQLTKLNLILPGSVASRLSRHRQKQREAAQTVAQHFLSPIMAARADAIRLGMKPGDHSRLPAEERAWLSGKCSLQDVAKVSAALGAALIGRVTIQARSPLPLDAQMDLRAAVAFILMGRARP